MIPPGVKVFLAIHPVDFRNYAATMRGWKNSNFERDGAKSVRI